MKRFTECDKWTKNKWFRKLDVRYKLFWLYILDQCDSVGVWEEDVEFASMLLSSDYEEKALLQIFNGKIVVIKNGKKWWVKDFCKFQYGILSEESKPHQSYIKMLKNHGLYSSIEIQAISMTKSAIRQRVTKKKRQDILNKYKYICQYCGTSGVEMVVDHIIPINSGGDNADNNLICVCSDCNIKKSDYSLKEFYELHSLSKSLDRVCRLLYNPKEKEKDKEKDNDKEKDKGEREDMNIIQKYYYDKYFEVMKVKYVADFGKDGKIFKNLSNILTEEELKKCIDEFLNSSDEFVLKAGYTVGVFRTQVNKIANNINSLANKHGSKSIANAGKLKQWIEKDSQ